MRSEGKSVLFYEKARERPWILCGKLPKLIAKARSSLSRRAREEAPGAEQPILENQRSGLFDLLSLAWLEA